MPAEPVGPANLGEHALALARQGFAVFPVAPKSKAPPLVKAWQVQATTDLKQVRAWWDSWPEANIGIHCDGLVVVDVDERHGGSKSLEALNGSLNLDTYTVNTPNGRHYYYRGLAQTGAGRLGAGLDIRAKGGYVIGPGSVRDDGVYRTVDVERRILEFPSGLCPQRRVTDDPVPRESLFALAPDAVARAVEWLTSWPGAVEGKGGDAYTYMTACRVRDFGCSEDQARQALADWNSQCSPPWDSTDLEKKIRNAYTYAQNPPGALTASVLGFKLPPPDLGELRHVSEADLATALEARYLVKGVLDAQSNAVMFGTWNVGKSFIALDLAASIATGTPWFGRRVRQGRVLYLCYEGARAMQKRMLALMQKFPTLAAAPLYWQPLTEPLILPKGRDILVESLLSFAKLGGAPDLIIIDPLSNALGGSDADADLIGQLNTLVSTLIQRQRCSVLRVHHSGHGDKTRSRGHSSLPASADTEIQVTADAIKLTKQRDDVRGQFNFWLDVVELGIDSDGDPVTTCCVRPGDPSIFG
jgi:Bifunctional DNA primase/polymerase, N-terminal/AAA domain